MSDAIRPHVRPSPIAGSWYPGEADELRGEIEALLGANPAQNPGPVRAVLCPHAGLVYSGPTAARAYAHLARQPVSRVVILSPNHRALLRGAAVDDVTHYETPLGRVPVDVEATRQLLDQPDFDSRPDAFADEHAIEMQLPFTQVLFPEATLVPIIVGELETDAFTSVAQTLRPILQDDTLLVISSDFMHYGDAFGYTPFATERDDPRRIAERIAETDAEALRAIAAPDFEAFRESIERTGNTICGRRPIGVLLRLLESWQPKLKATIQHYTNSGEMTNDWDRCVSYASLVFAEE